MENTAAAKKDEFEQLKKNTVSPEYQWKNSQYVRFIHHEGRGKRILFVGNSITYHDILHEIGWHNAWGMAASAEDKDYVHRLMAKLRDVYEDAACCICKAAVWERGYKDAGGLYDNFRDARDFDADIIVMRFIENCPTQDFEPETFRRELGIFLGYLNKSGKARVIMTTGFWKHPGDSQIRAYAEEHGLPLIELGDLGEKDEMKAIGLFGHRGVANHPGDLGMEKIADRLYEKIVCDKI